VVATDFAVMALPEAADLVWTSQNYHDLHLAKLNLDVAAANRAIFQALKPGGLYVVVDHAAAAGTGLDIPDKLHRIDPAIVRREVEAAGFKYLGESTVLRNPADDHSLAVFDPAIRGHTDQFVYKFQKPN
jgi:predicted methyltransferase